MELSALSAVPTMTPRPPSLPPGATAVPSDSVRPGTSGAVPSSLQPLGTFTDALDAAAEPVSAPVSAAGSAPPPPPEPPSRKPSTSAMTAPTPSAIGNALLLGFSPSRAGLGSGFGLGSRFGLAAFGARSLRSFFGLAFGSGFWRSASGMTVAFGSYS